MDISLAGRAAIITGGSKGIGLAHCARGSRRRARMSRIVARGRDALDAAEKQIRASGRQRGRRRRGRCWPSGRCQARLRRGDERVRQDRHRRQQCRHVARRSVRELTDEVMQQDLDQKLFAAIRLTRLVWPQMKERRWGRIINVLNIGAKAPRAGSAPTTDLAGGRHGADQGAGRRGRAAQHSGQRDCWSESSKPISTCRRPSAPASRSRTISRTLREGHSARAHRQARGVRQPGLPPGVRRRLLHHRHRDQRGWRPLAGRLNRPTKLLSWPGSACHSSTNDNLRGRQDG